MDGAGWKDISAEVYLEMAVEGMDTDGAEGRTMIDTLLCSIQQSWRLANRLILTNRSIYRLHAGRR